MRNVLARLIEQPNLDNRTFGTSLKKFLPMAEGGAGQRKFGGFPMYSAGRWKLVHRHGRADHG
jgi:hypothetical protein